MINEGSPTIGMFLDGRHEVLEDDGWIRDLREATGNDRLFVYHHLEVGSYVLAAYTHYEGEAPTCIEIGAYEEYPANSGTPFSVFVALCSPASENAVSDMVAQKRAARIEQEQANYEERMRRAKRAKARNDDYEARLYAHGITPLHVDLKGDDETTERLVDLARSANRIMATIDGGKT